MEELIGTYGVLIDPSADFIDVVHFPNGIVGLSELRSTIGCEWVECLSMTDEIDVWLNEEGFIDGTAERVGTFRIVNGADSRQTIFSGRALLLTSSDEDCCGWDEETAEDIKNSLEVKFNEMPW